MSPKVSLQCTDTERFAYLDALRGIAILGVLLVHSALLTRQDAFPLREYVPKEDMLLWFVCFTGQRGVQLFYMVSAFTLFLSLDSGRKERFRWSNFYIRRFFRIAPMFYLAIVANLLLFGRVISDKPIHSELNTLDIVLGFLFLHGWDGRAINNVALGGWSVGVEASFYMLVPYLFTRIKKLREAIALFVVSAVVLEWISLQAAAQPENFRLKEFFQFLWFPMELPVFVLGIITYLTWKQYIKPLREANGPTERQLPRLELSMLLLMASTLIYLGNLPFVNESLYCSSFLFLPLVLALSLHPWKLLVNGFTRFMGRISFSVYLCHFFVLRIVGRIMERVDAAPSHLVTHYIYKTPLGLAVGYFMVFAISVPLCVLTWKFVEQPGIRSGRAWIRRREERASQPAPAEVGTLPC